MVIAKIHNVFKNLTDTEQKIASYILEFPDVLYRLSRSEYTKKMNQIYKSVANGCIALQDKLGSYASDRMSVYKNKQEEIRKILSETPGAEEIKKMLGLAELDMEQFYGMYSAQKINDAIMYAKDLKDRYSVLWLNYDLFGE